MMDRNLIIIRAALESKHAQLALRDDEGVASAVASLESGKVVSPSIAFGGRVAGV